MMVGNMPVVILVAESVKDYGNPFQNVRIVMIYGIIQEQMKVNQKAFGLDNT